MLVELSVENLAVVERATLVLGPGFTALSGETGAGKSLLLGALSLLLGDRADADVVRAGEARARLSARFALDPGPAREAARALLDGWGIAADDGEIVVRREIAREGRSRAWINQSPVTVGALAELGPSLVELHGQQEQAGLLAPDRPRDLLDRWASLDAPRTAVAVRHAAFVAARDARAAFARESERAREEMDRWSFVHEELVRAQLVPGEFDELTSRLARLRHAGRLLAALARAQAALGGAGGDTGGGGGSGAIAGAAEAERAVRDAALVDPALAPLADELHAAALTLGEALRAVEVALDPESLDPAEGEAAEARHAMLQRLAQKHHKSGDELIAFRDELAARLARFDDADATRARLDEAAREAAAALASAAAALTRQRRAAARKLEPLVARELAALGLERARLGVAVLPLDAPGPTGGDRVEFVFAPNAGEEPRPLAKIASGGELSRVLLAFKSLLAAQDGVGTLFFDEIDAGIGGAVARAVGERLHALGRVRQVLCVTHLPVIAAYADHQFAVAKAERGGRTFATAEPLDEAARIDELSRMLAGDARTATTARQARELLKLRDVALERA
jgi:DNA repair protein RecN (Recombination protein N)